MDATRQEGERKESHVQTDVEPLFECMEPYNIGLECMGVGGTGLFVLGHAR